MAKEAKQEKKGLTWQLALIIAVGIILAMLVAMFAFAYYMVDHLVINGTYQNSDSTYTFELNADGGRVEIEENLDETIDKDGPDYIERS
ncbi:MAG: hypothetical protein Q4E47_02660 [Candidatus Saccharibacteria bacterium]|nr:hypothetical protein [Candidatus Saccharibacteria bacterium]